MPRSVLVAGDLIWDYNLVQQETMPKEHRETLPAAVLNFRAGGAWYLHDLVALASQGVEDVRLLAPSRQEAPPGEPRSRVSHAYQIWTLHEQDDQEGRGRGVWRIHTFLGCRAADPGLPPVPVAEDVPDPEVLVLDDLCLGFRDDPALWPAALRDQGAPRRIVLKASAAPDSSPLWTRLLSHHADRLTVVLSGKTLRERGADISEALSWDRTIEGTVAEFQRGPSARDLARCRRVVVHYGCAGAASFSRCRVKWEAPDGPSLPPDGVWDEPAAFERFLYWPDELEGTWKAHCPGTTFGATSALTAAVVRHELEPGEFPLTLALGRGLTAVRLCHAVGGGHQQTFQPDAAHRAMGEAFNDGDGPAVRKALDPDGERAPQDDHREWAFDYWTAFPHDLLDCGPLKDQPPERSDLLHDLTGVGLDYVAAKAVEVVIDGPRKALSAAPKASYGKYLTVDREEIERINAIRNLIQSYRRNPKDRRPLSLAVFGPPGSGKSFAIKQLARELFGARKETRTFNLSQFRLEEELNTAFHQVRDESVHGQIPLVFWDEFDTDELRWLKYFLAPMQDAEFRVGSVVHPFGKAIFVFAGGTCETLEAFDKLRTPGASVDEQKQFRDRKGPDFISRLRGFVNIKGPNPAAEQEVAHLIRRAILLRSSLERHWPGLIERGTGRAAISTGVVRGFLRVERYLHGARSLDAIVSMSTLSQARQFVVPALPSDDLLSLHVSADFMDRVREGELEVPVIELLAEACHRGYCAQRKAQGYTYGPVRDDVKKTHPLLVPFAELPASFQESNRKSARLTQAKLLDVGLRIERTRPDAPDRDAMDRLIADRRERLMRLEHDIWLRDHLLQGYEWAETTRDELRLHRDVAPFEAVPPEDQVLDGAIIDGIPEVLWANGYTLAPLDGPEAAP